MGKKQGNKGTPVKGAKSPKAKAPQTPKSAKKPEEARSTPKKTDKTPQKQTTPITPTPQSEKNEATQPSHVDQSQLDSTDDESIPVVDTTVQYKPGIFIPPKSLTLEEVPLSAPVVSRATVYARYFRYSRDPLIRDPGPKKRKLDHEDDQPAPEQPRRRNQRLACFWGLKCRILDREHWQKNSHKPKNCLVEKSRRRKKAQEKTDIQEQIERLPKARKTFENQTMHDAINFSLDNLEPACKQVFNEKKYFFVGVPPSRLELYSEELQSLGAKAVADVDSATPSDVVVVAPELSEMEKDLLATVDPWIKQLPERDFLDIFAKLPRVASVKN